MREDILRVIRDPYFAKTLIWFENCAHLPQFEEPARFRDVL